MVSASITAEIAGVPPVVLSGTAPPGRAGGQRERLQRPADGPPGPRVRPQRRRYSPARLRPWQSLLVKHAAVLPPVTGFPGLRVLRPAPTAARPPTPLPGFAGYRPGIASRQPAAGGAETALPSSQDDHPHVQRPIRRRVHQRPLLDQERLPWPSPSPDRLGTLSSPLAGRSLDDACSGFTHVADRAVAPPRFAPGLSTTHGGFTTGDPGISPDRTHTGRPP